MTTGETTQVADTLVVGGGLVGAALAWGLVRAGRKVVMIDEGDVALRASRGNFGLVWVQGKGRNYFDYARWTRRSADLWPEFAGLLAEQTGIDPDYRKPGGVAFCLSGEELEAARAQALRMDNVNGALGYGVEIIDRRQTAELVPGIGPDVVGATYGRHDGHASPLRLLRALHAGFRAAGGIYAGDARAETVAPEGSGFAVTTARGRFLGGQLVLAAGHGNSRLGPQLGLEVPIRPEKGQILVTERARPFLTHPTHVVRQTEEGTVMIGDSHEDTGYSTRSDTPILSEIARNALRCLPELGRLRVVRSWGAVRILSPDNAPVYQESAAHPGAFTINCHSGVTLAGAHALALAPRLAEGRLGPEFDPFSPRRFHGQAH